MDAESSTIQIPQISDVKTTWRKRITMDPQKQNSPEITPLRHKARIDEAELCGESGYIHHWCGKIVTQDPEEDIKTTMWPME